MQNKKPNADAAEIGRILSFFVRATNEIGASLDWNETLKSINACLVPDLADSCTIWWLFPNGKLEKQCQKSMINFKFQDLSQDDVAQVIKTGIYHFVKRERQSSICVVMRLRNEVVGAIVLHKKTEKGILTNEDMVITEELANRGAIALDNARMYHELKNAEENLQKAKASAEVANQAKTFFLANMSHEIRTPLTAILGYIELIMSSSSTEVAQSLNEWGQRINANGKHLLHLVDEILDLSKVESGKIELHSELVFINDFVMDVYYTMIPQVHKKQNQLTVSMQGQIPSEASVDLTRLKQILINILGNANKFTERGSVSLVASFLPETSQLCFQISDTGLGLNEKQIEKIFQPFTQADSSHTRRFGGTGLGLALSRRLAQQMGGDVSLLKSSPNRGSTFQVLVQVQVSKSKFIQNFSQAVRREVAVERSQSQCLAGLHILLAEDAPDNQLIMTHMLKKEAAFIDIASDGIQALKMALQKPYDIILMDIQMPKMDGYMVTRELRRSGYRKPIIALTAHALENEKKECLQAGCNDHLTKPVDRHQLIKTVSNWVQNKSKT